MIIDEAGNFEASAPDFTDQMMYHAEKCLNDARVLAVTYFLWLDPTNSPGNILNSWAQSVPNLPVHLNRLRNMPDVPILTGLPERREPISSTRGLAPADSGTTDSESTIRVLFEDGTVRRMALEEYLRGVVPR